MTEPTTTNSPNPAGQPGNGADAPTDDLIQPFHLNGREIRGRLIRLGAVAHAALTRHDLPPAAASLLGEAMALTAMMASAMKFDGIFTLQVEGDGPARMLVADYRNNGDMRGYIRLSDSFDAATDTSSDGLLGKGVLALTVDREGEHQRYQGTVELEGDNLASSAEHYFSQSDQVPSLFRLFAGHGPDGNWRVGGLMLQSLPKDPDEDKAQEDWLLAETLAATIKPQELLDPTLSPAELLYRLFHEDGVWLHDAMPMRDQCTCSAERIGEVVRSFPEAEVRELAVDTGTVAVDCQFCGRSYSLPLSSLIQAS